MFGSRQRLVNQWSRLRLTGARGLARALAATLFPPHCCLCGFPGASLDLDLCSSCRADLPWETSRQADVLVALRYEYPVDQMIRELCDRTGVTAIVVSHDLTSIFTIADRIAMLYKGKVQTVGTPDEVKRTEDPIVRQFIEGRAQGPIET